MKLLSWILWFISVNWTCASIIYDDKTVSFAGIRDKLLEFYKSLDERVIFPHKYRDHQFEVELLSNLTVELERTNNINYWKKLKKINYALKSSEEFLRYLLSSQQAFNTIGIHNTIEELLSVIDRIEEGFVDYDRACCSVINIAIFIATKTESESTSRFRRFLNEKHHSRWIYDGLIQAFTDFSEIAEHVNDATIILNDFIVAFNPYVCHLKQVLTELGLQDINPTLRDMHDMFDHFYVTSFVYVYDEISSKFEGDDAKISSIIRALLYSLFETQSVFESFVAIRNRFTASFRWKKFDFYIRSTLKDVSNENCRCFYCSRFKESIASFDIAYSIPFKFFHLIWVKSIEDEIKSISINGIDEQFAVALIEEIFDCSSTLLLIYAVSKIPNLNLVPPPTMIRIIKRLMYDYSDLIVLKLLDRFQSEMVPFYAEEYLQIAAEYDDAFMYRRVLELKPGVYFHSALLMPLIRKNKLNILKMLADRKITLNSDKLLEASIDANNIEAIKLCLKMGCDPQIENPQFKTFYLTAIKSKLLDSDSKRCLLMHAYYSSDWDFILALAFSW